MPFYEFTCQSGHTTEARRSYEDTSINCPSCGEPAQREAVYRSQGIITESSPSRFTPDYERFIDRAPYIDDAHSKAEQEVGQYMKRPPWYNAGIARARARAIEYGDTKAIKKVNQLAKTMDKNRPTSISQEV